mmetsp:Transcript_7344/g.26764  ORF Transcript_7344/g.26764 Transcript_7344/m.26764 type:complete len:263 (-) Transcript_7344:83-871(-)
MRLWSLSALPSVPARSRGFGPLLWSCSETCLRRASRLTPSVWASECGYVSRQGSGRPQAPCWTGCPRNLRPQVGAWRPAARASVMAACATPMRRCQQCPPPGEILAATLDNFGVGSSLCKCWHGSPLGAGARLRWRSGSEPGATRSGGRHRREPTLVRRIPRGRRRRRARRRTCGARVPRAAGREAGRRRCSCSRARGAGPAAPPRSWVRVARRSARARGPVAGPRPWPCWRRCANEAWSQVVKLGSMLQKDATLLNSTNCR